MNTPLPALPAPLSGQRLTRPKYSPERLYAEKLYAANTGLVGLSLKRFPFLTGEAREDALGAGMLGLWIAAQRFDPARGFAFGSYAVPVIRSFILRRLKEDRQQVRLPCVSLETPVGSGDGSSDLADLVADPNAEMPGERLMESAGFEVLLFGLPAHHQNILRKVYLEDKAPTEIGEEAGGSRQKAHAQHQAALRALRKQERRQRQYPRV